MRIGTLPRFRLLVGLLLTGQGFLFLIRINDHEASMLTGLLLIFIGGGLIAWNTLARTDGSTAPRATRANVRGAAVWALVIVGLTATAGLVTYNTWTGSTLSPPEWAILIYGITLLWAATNLDRRVLKTDVRTLVGYSLPLVLAPLTLFALNGALAAQWSATPLAWYIHNTLVPPMALLLSLTGLDVSSVGDTVRIATPERTLFLTVGIVCAGLYATTMFLGILALFVWQNKPCPMRLVVYLATGVAGLHAANVARLALLGYVGSHWGGGALQSVHRHAGWLLFLGWTIAYWWIILRLIEPRRDVAQTP